MTPVTQSHLHAPPESYGSCWRACLASVLDLPERAVPHFVDPRLFSDGSGDAPSVNLLDYIHGAALVDWWYAGLAWLRMLGYELVEVDLSDEYAPVRDEYLISSGGHSPRSPFPPGHAEATTHAVVYGRQTDGSYRMVHDPHPSRDGIIGEPSSFYALRPLNP